MILLTHSSHFWNIIFLLIISFAHLFGLHQMHLYFIFNEIFSQNVKKKFFDQFVFVRLALDAFQIDQHLMGRPRIVRKSRFRRWLCVKYNSYITGFYKGGKCGCFVLMTFLSTLHLTCNPTLRAIWVQRSNG